MRILYVLLLAVAVSAVAAPDAWAQRGQGRGGRGFGGPGGPGRNSFGLLTQKSVQDELKLSDDQVKKVDEHMEKQRGGFAALRDLGDDERQQKMEERDKANQAAIAEILNPDQLKRFKQISLQQRGAQAFGDPEIAQALNLTSEQKDRIKAIQDAGLAEMRELFQAGDAGGDRQELQKKGMDLRNASNEKAQAVLTTEQQAKWKEMTGEPFKGEIRQGPRGGNRRGNA